MKDAFDALQELDALVRDGDMPDPANVVQQDLVSRSYVTLATRVLSLVEEVLEAEDPGAGGDVLDLDAARASIDRARQNVGDPAALRSIEQQLVRAHEIRTGHP